MESPILSTMVVLYNTTLKFDTSKLLETDINSLHISKKYT